MENQEEQVTQEEQSTDRTFITLVAVLGGLLVLGIGAFVAWALLIAPNMRANIESQNESTFATNTAIAVAAAATQTAAVTPTPTNTPMPTDTPVPTNTPTPPPATDTPTPAPTATLALGTPEAGGQGGSVSKAMPDTGVGVLGGAALAGGLGLLLVLVRRLRKTA
jgi:cell division septation protein DedD